jgi:hypothetical protein
MQYHVPQFLEVEDKIFGFITLKQFLYILGGVAISYLAYTYLKLIFSIPIVLVSMSFCAALAFYKPYNKPFMFVVEAFLTYISSPRLYIWKKIPKKLHGTSMEKTGPEQGVYIPPITESNLKDLAWSLDIREHEVKKTGTKKGVPLLTDL